MLWENYVILERHKFLKYSDYIGFPDSFFWRTHNQNEIDLIEDYGSKLNAYEIKWSNKENFYASVEWQKLYPDSNFVVINRNNYLDFIGVENGES